VNKRTKFSMLAVDGGGIRGIVPARVLQEIEQHFDRPIAELFDLVAGTSTGGIIALGLTRPRPGTRTPQFQARDLVALYHDHGGEIFSRSLWRRASTAAGLAGVKYSAKPLEELLDDRFGDTMLSDALLDVCIPSYDLSGPSAYFFKRSYARDATESWDVNMALAARATSAAPTYFDPARVAGDHALVDGGVFANNPAVAGYADALDIIARRRDLYAEDTEIQVVSIGTGQPPQDSASGGPIPVSWSRAQGWGLAHWARPVLEVVFDGVAEAAEYQLRRLCRHADGQSPRYHRLQSPLENANQALDDASDSNIELLMQDADILIDKERDTLEGIYAALADVAADRDAAEWPQAA
jgi:predicted acylesterase/phospholipase RssA